MVKLTTCTIALVLMLAGCVNAYVRCPGTEPKIDKTYKSTEASASMVYVIMFPQIAMPSRRNALILENAISIPIGCLCFIDVAVEGVVDTACYPIDKVLSNRRAIQHIDVDAQTQEEIVEE